MGSVDARPRGMLRTSLAVDDAGGRHREVIFGEQFKWSFRMHYHAGDEIVQVRAGRALLRLGQSCRLVEAGETVRVPAGIVHRFEPLDTQGWGFVSEFSTPTASGSEGEAGTKLIAQIRDLLAERGSLRTDVGLIAQACALSKGYLSRRFRHEVGTSLHDFHVLIALHNAKSELKCGSSIVEAALQAGFYDQAHLTREFVRTYGFTPGVFRAAWQTAPTLPSPPRH